MASKKELQALIVLAGKIDPSLQKAIRGAEKNTKGLNKTTELLGKTATKAFNILKTSVAVGAVALGAAMVYVGKKGIELASDLNEVQNVVDVTFGQSADQINSWSKSALKSYGLSELAAKQYNGTIGAMMKSSGISNDNLVSMSKNLTGLAGDFASFYNLKTDEAFNKIRAGISGETEPLKQLGINMNIANLEAYALSQGINTAYNKMSQADKTILRYNYLLNASKDAQGDFARTQGQFANQQRVFQERFKELSATIMQKALPAFTKLYQKGNELMESFANDPEKIAKLQVMIERVVNAIVDGVPTVISLAKSFGKAILFIFRAGYKTYQFIQRNWSIIEPLILGIVSAMVAWKAITVGMAIYKGIMAGIRAGTIAATIAQWGLNAAIWASPMTWYVIMAAAAIGVLVGVFYYLYKNWDKVSKFLSNSWEMIKHGFAVGINFIVDKLNWLIEKMNKIPGVEIPLIPKMDTSAYNAATNAQTSGTVQKFARGGFANRPSIFGEAGPEAAIPLKRTPRSLSLLKATAEKLGFDVSNKKGGNTFVFAPNYGSEAPSKQRMQEDFEEFKRKVKQVIDDDRRESFA